MDKLPRPKAKIFDVQGTLIDVRPIRHYVTGVKKDFNAFHMATVRFCHPNWDVLKRCHADQAAGLKILVGSGMTDDFRQGLNHWLATYKVYPEDVQMRPYGDWRSDVLLKNKMATDWEEHYEIIGAEDDNPGIIDLWERRGYPVNTVPGWEEQGETR